MNQVEQATLLLAPAHPSQDVPLEVIAKRKTLLGALNLMFDLSGLEDKEIYMALGIDAGHFSNIRKGKQGCNFPTEKFNDAMDLCHSEIPLIWLAHSRNKGLHVLESEKDRQLREERERNEELAKENKLLRDLMQGRVA